MSMRLAPRLALVLSAAFGAAAFAAVIAACGTDAVGIETCQKIETARCNRAQGCNISLGDPLHTGSDLASCIRFYRDACQHGLASNTDPGGPTVAACVDAINNGDCTVVLKPESDPSCAFLIPPAPAPVVEAGADADAAVEAATDAVAE
jgi:hypothetical protein